VILLTGATGNVGSALLRRLVAENRPVRVLVRDPRRLGPERVRVQIALGDLSDASSFRHALRGVDTVVHLAAAIRDQGTERATIEEVNGLGTLRLVRAAERAGVKRFIFFSAIGASLHSQSRFFRTKALAEEAVESSDMQTTVFTPSIIYSPGDPWITLLGRLAVLPVVPVAGSGRALYEPIWALDAAGAVMGLLAQENGDGSGGAAGDGNHRRIELAGPERLSYDDIVRTFLHAKDRHRRLVHVPLPLVRWGLKAVEEVQGSMAFATWDEAELMEIPMVSQRGTTDAEALGVHPLPMEYVLRRS
jgi:NADH dehydrogenase